MPVHQVASVVGDAGSGPDEVGDVTWDVTCDGVDVKDGTRGATPSGGTAGIVVAALRSGEVEMDDGGDNSVLTLARVELGTSNGTGRSVSPPAGRDVAYHATAATAATTTTR
jgi:hypothetical protein